MAMLLYVFNMSLDGYIADADGAVDWGGPPDPHVFAATTDLLRSVGTYLYGRRLYEMMAHWETNPALAAQSQLTANFARVWQAADKIVYSTSLSEGVTVRTRVERRFDPAAVRTLKEEASRDLTIGGPNLAASAFEAGLIDECRFYVWPAILGGGKPALPTGVRSRLQLLDEHRFDNGVVYLRHRVLH